MSLLHFKNKVHGQEKEAVIQWLKTLKPIWEMRYSKNHPPPVGEENRQLLRPVYWLGNWQFACLGYYHPPKGTHHRCVKAEPYPEPLQKIVAESESIVRKELNKEDVPPGWHLNTCLINFYGEKETPKGLLDCARVGEHKDFELGPVVSLSFGEKALFQFVKSSGRQQKSTVALQQWLGDGDLQIFGGYRFKKQLFHRVARVEDKGFRYQLQIERFHTRRINFTFRYVPNEHIVRWKDLPTQDREDTVEYMRELSLSSHFFKNELGAALI